jgi:hypothetical protein
MFNVCFNILNNHVYMVQCSRVTNPNIYTIIRDFMFVAVWEQSPPCNRRVYCSTFIHVSSNALCMQLGKCMCC